MTLAPAPGLAIFTGKAFGDLVIANTALRRVAAPSGMSVVQVIPRHLVELSDALGASWPVVGLDNHEAGVPALFDVRKAGLGAALRSAVDLRQSLSLVGLTGDTVWLFDRLGARERFLSLGRNRVSLPPAAPNIYSAYGDFFSGQGFARFDPDASFAGSDPLLGIFPGSRLPTKNLPLSVIETIFDAARARDVPARLFLLEGERPDLEQSQWPKTIVTRRFAAMLDAVRTCTWIVSADSMPAHLAESLHRPVFVVSPVENRYWLPLSAFLQNRWSLIGETNGASLGSFLDTAMARG